MAIKSAPATQKFDKLRRLLGQHATAAFELDQWQKMKDRPCEQWRGEAAFMAKINEYEARLAVLNHEIANEMRARLGVTSGTLTIQKAA